MANKFLAFVTENRGFHASSIKCSKSRHLGRGRFGEWEGLEKGREVWGVGCLGRWVVWGGGLFGEWVVWEGEVWVFAKRGVLVVLALSLL